MLDRVFCLLNLGMRQRWRVGLVCKTNGFHLSGFESHQPHKKKGSYTVGVAGSTVNALSSDSGGSTPSLPTKFSVRLVRSRTLPFHGKNMGSNPIQSTKFWSHRLSVRTPGFHPGKRSSILRGTTK